jgi:hypothetical protein
MSVVQRSCHSELGHFVRLASKWRSIGLLFERRAWVLLRSCPRDVIGGSGAVPAQRLCEGQAVR